jgi:hypothetical protein
MTTGHALLEARIQRDPRYTTNPVTPTTLVADVRYQLSLQVCKLTTTSNLRDLTRACVWAHSGQRTERARVLIRNRHHKLSALLDAFRLTLHDRLLPRVEAHALHPIRMHVAEQTLRPSTEAVPRHCRTHAR